MGHGGAPFQAGVTGGGGLGLQFRVMAELHAFILIGCVAATLAMVATAKRRTFGGRRERLIAVLAPLGLALLPATMRHMCAEGNPFMQWFVPLLCLWATFMCIGPRVLRRGIAVVLTFVMFGLSWHFIDFVHSPEWTGNPAWHRAQEAVGQSTLRSAQAGLLTCGEGDASAYAAGWLRELDAGACVRESAEYHLRDRRIVRGDGKRVWHTWITGLYQRVTISQDVWYPGGRLGEGAMKLELRDR